MVEAVAKDCNRCTLWWISAKKAEINGGNDGSNKNLKRMPVKHSKMALI